MRGTQKVLGGFILMIVALALAAIPQASSRSARSLTQDINPEPVPAFHSTMPAGQLPTTLSPSLFTGDPVAQNAYSIAARIKKTLYQQPCYCHCDRSQGHGSLLDCYVSKHAAVCGVCEREDFYAYEQSHKGKTGAQIREGIEHGDWQGVDMTKYLTALPASVK